MNVLKTQVYYTRLKAMRLYHLIDKDDDYQQFKQKMMNPEISSINNNKGQRGNVDEWVF